MRTFILVTIIASAFANPKYPDICGVENQPLVESRIMGGQEAERNQFPWLVFLTTFGHCTGSILDENWIMTAKHCVDVKGKAWISAGVHDTSFRAKEPHKQARTSSEIHVSSKGDFALIKLDKPLTFNQYVRPACLPTREMAKKNYLGKYMTITGWGDNESYTPKLHYSKFAKVVQCWYGSYFFCTEANKGLSICLGDSGGPINYEIEYGKYVQMGVNSFGTKTCDYGLNGYARLYSHLDFIQETTGMVIE